MLQNSSNHMIKYPLLIWLSIHVQHSHFKILSRILSHSCSSACFLPEVENFPDSAVKWRHWGWSCSHDDLPERVSSGRKRYSAMQQRHDRSTTWALCSAGVFSTYIGCRTLFTISGTSFMNNLVSMKTIMNCCRKVSLMARRSLSNVLPRTWRYYAARELSYRRQIVCRMVCVIFSVLTKFTRFHQYKIHSTSLLKFWSIHRLLFTHLMNPTWNDRALSKVEYELAIKYLGTLFWLIQPQITA